MIYPFFSNARNTLKLDVLGEIRTRGSSNGYVGFAATASTSSTTYTWPVSAGTSGYVLKTDGTGTLTWAAPLAGLIPSDITNVLGYTPLNKAGDTLTGTLTLAAGTFTIGPSGFLIVPNPVLSTDAVNKQYVDSFGQWLISGSDIYRSGGNVGIGTSTPSYALDTTGDINTAANFRKNGTIILPAYPVRVATTANIASLTGTQTIDGVAVTAGDRILVKNQSLVKNNGVYVVAAGAWSRAADLDTWAESIGYRAFATEGTVWGGMTFVSTTTVGGTLDTTNIEWIAQGTTIGSLNTANGYKSLNSTTTGTRNTATGYTALAALTTGVGNTANGAYSLTVNTTGGSNTGTGDHSLSANTTGNYNTATGYDALQSNTTGSHNAATGYFSIRMNTTGQFNTANGEGSLDNNVAAHESTAIGYYAMFNANNTPTSTTVYNTALGAHSLEGSATPASNTGIKNTALGHSSLNGMTSGSNNVGVGYNSGSAITTGSNNVIIGSNDGTTIATSSNYIIIADGAGTSRILVDNNGNVGIGTPGPSYLLEVAGNAKATAFISTSDRRLKKDISPAQGLSAINQLNGVSFKWIKDGSDDMGVIAQDVEKVFPASVTTDKAGMKAVKYNSLFAPVIEAIKELYRDFKSLVARVTNLESKEAEKEKEIEKIKAENAALKDYICSKDKKAAFCP